MRVRRGSPAIVPSGVIGSGIVWWFAASVGAVPARLVCRVPHGTGGLGSLSSRPPAAQSASGHHVQSQQPPIAVHDLRSGQPLRLSS